MMDQQLKQDWIEALLSGDYKQGYGQVRDDQDNFCCLGVLCNLHAKAHPIFAETQTDKTSYNGFQGLPGPLVWKWANSNGRASFNMPFEMRASGGVRQTFKKNQLVTYHELNDHGCSFKQIARVIEAIE